MDRSQTSERVSGPLAGFEVAFRAELERTGYTPSSVSAAISAMGQLSGWMQRNGITAEMLSPAVLDALPRRLRGTRPVVRFLRDCGAIPEATCVDGAGPVGLLVGEFREWLVGERGLAAQTVRCYGSHAHTFLAWLGDPLEQVLAGLKAGTVTTYMVEHCEQVSCANAKASVTALRALLRFLHVAGHVPTGLVGAVPAVAGWRQASLPRGLEAGQAEQLLAGCDRSTAVGQRDYAMLMLLAQLGLRGAELAALDLDDIDWHAGEVIIHGKAARIDRLPLPVAAGEALAEYLTESRPRCESTAVFVMVRAPHAAISPHAVRQVMYRACERAGLPRLGAHRLRHALASDLLRAGGSLAEVGQVLRHRTALATSIYAKVDERSLSALVRPFPGGVR
ncbi:site-specific integrase [soil metagenome]